MLCKGSWGCNIHSRTYECLLGAIWISIQDSPPYWHFHYTHFPDDRGWGTERSGSGVGPGREA